MGKYKVSIITPLFNAEDKINNTIQSVMNQTIGFENIELLLIDDCSKDNTKNIIKKFANTYPNIKTIFLNENSGGPGKPRNIGIKNATSNYIMFLDQDDQYLPEAVEILYNTIISEKSDFVVTSHINCYDKNNFEYSKIDVDTSSKDPINIDPNKNTNEFTKILSFIGSWSKIFDKKLILNNGMQFLENKLNEDVIFHIKSLRCSKKITLLPNIYI